MASRGTLCKFFAQGYCRFGDKCYYEHSVGGGGQGGGFGSSSYSTGGGRPNPFKLDNRYNALNNSSAGNRSLFGGGNENSNPQSVTEIISSVTTEMLTWEQSGMWLFSSFFHSKEANCKLPGFEDYSQEELRHEAYSESPKPHLQVNYKVKERQLVNDVREKIAKLKNPDAVTKQQLTAFVELAKHGGSVSTTTVSSPFGAAAVSPAPTSTASAAAKTAEETLTAIGTEVSTWVRSGMWLLSEYCSSKESPTIPGFKDLSPEEVRFEAYSENPNPQLQTNSKVREHGLMTEARMKIEQLRNPDPETKQLLMVFLSQTPGKAPAAAAPSAGGGLFGATASTTQKSLFGDSQSRTVTSSVFGGSATNSVFGGSNAAMAPNSSPFGSSPFGGTNNSSGLFGKAATSTTEFGQGSASTGLFGQSNPSAGLFGTAPGIASPSTSSTGLFGKPDSSSVGLFGKPADLSQATGLFGKPDSSNTGLFGKPADSNQATGLFGKPSDSNQATGLFGKPADSSQASGLFGKPDSGNTGLFGKTTDSSPGLFGKPAQTGLFGKPGTPGLFGDVTQSPQGSASDSSQQSSVAKDQATLPLYTPIENLTESERADFEAPEFTLGRIPTRPPAKQHV